MITTSPSIIKFSVCSAQEQLTHRGWPSGTLHGGLSLALHVLHQDTDLNKRDVGIHGLCGRQFARREQRAGMQARVDRMPLSAVSLIQTCYCIALSNMTGVDLAKSGPIGVPAFSAVITNCTHNLDYASGSQLMNCVYGVAVHVFGIAWVANVKVSVTSCSNPSWWRERGVTKWPCGSTDDLATCHHRILPLLHVAPQVAYMTASYFLVSTVHTYCPMITLCSCGWSLCSCGRSNKQRMLPKPFIGNANGS